MSKHLFLALLGIASCMALASTGYSEGVAVVGCGVLGTSLCKQILACPDFDGREGELMFPIQCYYSDVAALAYSKILSHWNNKDK